MFEFTPIASGIHFWPHNNLGKRRKVNLEEAIDSEDYGLLGDVLQEPISGQDETEGVYDLDLELVRQLAIGGGLGGGEGLDLQQEQQLAVEYLDKTDQPMDTSDDLEAPPNPPPRPPKSPTAPPLTSPPPNLPPKKSTTPVKNKNFFKSLFSKSPKKVGVTTNPPEITESQQILEDLDSILAIESVEQYALYTDHNVPKATLSECDDFSLRGRNNN